MGQLRNKCVRDFANPSLTTPTNSNHWITDESDSIIDIDPIPDAMGIIPSRNWTEWVLSPRNWYFNPETEKPELCGNASGAR